MAWEIGFAESFLLDLARSPKKVRNAWRRTALPLLRDRPATSDPPSIKKLAGFKSLWRLRVSDDYRLIYSLDQKSQTVSLLLLDHRSKVYERAGVSEAGVPVSRIIAQAPELLEVAPTPEQIGFAEFDLASQGAGSGDDAERALSSPIELESLVDWGIPEEYHDQLIGVATEDRLLAISSEIPKEVMERVLYGLWPPVIEEITQGPVRVASNSGDLLSASEGMKSIESFLLRLDEEQKSFVARFDGPSPTGPWLLKGGPGSGKSTVALYCIASLVRQLSAQLPMGQRPPKILLTTYTHALINGAEHLLDSMGISRPSGVLEITNVDKLVARDLPNDWRSRKVLKEFEVTPLATSVLAECLLDDKKFAFTRNDVPFLVDEIDWVIVGQDIVNLEGYLNADRTGRGRALPDSQRRQVWEFWTRLKDKFELDKVCLFSQRIQVALKNTSAQYDYVFIDEAQDLKPVAIRYCVRLCRAPSRVFLTADSNQSIYGAGISWPRVAEELSFKGRARILRRNYRTTHEIWRAIADFAAEGADRETLDVEPVYSGTYPVLVRYESRASMMSALGDYLAQSLLSERLPPSCAAVLCTSLRQAEEVAASLRPELNAKAMNSKGADLAHPGVKVLTMHAAKGLQFPVVAVVGLQLGKLPVATPTGMDEAEHRTRQKRLLFVACSRAMRRLAVFAPNELPSPFVAGLTDEFWDLVDAG